MNINNIYTLYKIYNKDIYRRDNIIFIKLSQSVIENILYSNTKIISI